MVNNLIEISVRNLVEFVYKGGSIDNSFRDKDAMTEGIKAHQIMQRSRGEGFESEVSLKHEFHFDGIDFIIKGRCDGIYFDEVYVIEEMKSTRVSLSEINEDYNFAHLAQCKMYGYFYSMEKKLDKVGIKLTYYNIESGKEKSFLEIYDFSSLENFFKDTIIRYIKYGKLKIDLYNKFLISSNDLEFPFLKYRKGQREMAVLVYKSITDKNRLFINAPTGIGKTMSTIFPTIKALGKMEGERFFYITAKTITRTVAEKTLNILVEKGLDIRCVFLTAKEKVCFKEECNCNKDYCEFASGYYDRINEVLYEILENELIINKSVIESYSKKFKVCPFELSLDISLYTEGVICDYNYIFDPRVSLKRMSNLTEDRILLIDEAHNLVDRTRDMFSAVLEKEKIMSLRRKIKNEKTLYKRLSSINQEFLNFKKLFDENNDEITVEIPEKLMYSIQKFLEDADSWLKINGNDSRYKEFLELYFDFSSYVRIARVYDENFTTILTRKNKNIFIKLYCLNPSELIKYITLQNRSTVFFSATLLPHPYFRNIFGEHESDRSLILTSPFNPENLKVSIFPVSTRYRDRKKTSKDIAGKIYEFVNRKTGNYLIFFPSYAYMTYIYNEILELHDDFYADVQTRDMDELKREEYLEKFVFNPSSTRIGFVTLGGIFSEGIDLIGNRLSGVVIVGVGIPQVCFERELIKEFYNSQGMFGYDYSYTFPGMNKVLQGAGRLIRTENDFGELLLIGDRYLSRKYRDMVPEDWEIKIIQNRKKG